MSSSANVADLVRLAHNLQAAKMYSLASCVMIYYDIALTMRAEVERIWMQPQYSKVTFLYALNRYLTPLVYVVIIVSFHQPWPIDVCDRYILFPEVSKIFTCTVIGIIFVLRIQAIYHGGKVVTFIAIAALVAEIAIKIWAFTDGVRLPLPEGIVGCILVGKNHKRFVFSWIAELGFDSIIFFMTLWRTWSIYRVQRVRPMSLLSLVIRDGVVYFAIIFLANVATVVLFLAAPPDMKAINASFSTIITSLMVSRLVLNLKGVGLQTAQTSRGPIVVQSYLDFPEDHSLGSHPSRHVKQLSNDAIRYELGRISRK